MKGKMWLLITGCLMSSHLIAQQLHPTQTIALQDAQHQVHINLKNSISEPVSRPNIIPSTPAQQEVSFTSDTSWTFDEQLSYGDERYQPTGYSITRDIGNENTFTRQYDQFFWMMDTEDWELSGRRFEYYADGFNDSTVYYGYSEGEITYGNRTRFVRNPEDGVSVEYYQDDFYSSGVGWSPVSRYQYYYNEDSTDYWQKTYYYDSFYDEYQLYEEQFMSEEELENEERVHSSENKRYSNSRVDYWTKHVTKYNIDNRVGSTTDYELNTSNEELIPTDSTHYNYLADFAEATSYYYSEGYGWEISEYSRTYSSAYETKEASKIDSILTFADVSLYDGVFELGPVSRKTIFIYDANDNLIEETYSHNFGTEFRASAKTLYEYEFIAGEYRQVKENYYTANDDLTELHLTRDISTRYNDDGEYYERTQYTLSEEGDTTSANKNQLIETEEALYSLDYFWNEDLHEFQRYYLVVHGFSEPVIQSAMLDERGYNTRRIEVSGGYPAIFNDGPIFMELGDTLDIILSAYNPDLSVPKVEITNLPKTATFDPQTRRFFWIVDDIEPSHMIYTVTDGDKSYSTKVLFMSGELMVGNESEPDVPNQIELFQNYPNPFNPNTVISYQLPISTEVRLQVFDMLGRKVADLVDGVQSAGLHSVHFNGSHLSSGVYYYQISTNNTSHVKSMMLIK